ncbi:MAG: ATP-binding protein [Pseudomonadota bacterium]
MSRDARIGSSAEKALVAQMADGVVVLDPTGVVCYANAAALRLFGLAREDALHGRLFGVPVTAAGIAEIELVSGTQVRLVELNAAKISWDTAPAWLLVLRDVTARKQRELGVFRKGQEFEQLAYTVSHDLQAPLRTIEQLAQVYLEDGGAAAESSDQPIRLIQSLAARGREMVSALVEYASLDSDADTKAPCDLQQALEDSCANLGAEIEATQAIVAALTPLPTVLANPINMVQVFQNLIANSLKYRSARTPEVSVNATLRAVDWRIDVIDNGVGIPQEQADYVFGMFAQLASSDAALSGNGLGLALCKKIIESHGGSIWIEPTEGVGCRVSFTLPL